MEPPPVVRRRMAPREFGRGRRQAPPPLRSHATIPGAGSVLQGSAGQVRAIPTEVETTPTLRPAIPQSLRARRGETLAGGIAAASGGRSRRCGLCGESCLVAMGSGRPENHTHRARNPRHSHTSGEGRCHNDPSTSLLPRRLRRSRRAGRTLTGACGSPARPASPSGRRTVSRVHRRPGFPPQTCPAFAGAAGAVRRSSGYPEGPVAPVRSSSNASDLYPAQGRGRLSGSGFVEGSHLAVTPCPSGGPRCGMLPCRPRGPRSEGALRGHKIHRSLPLRRRPKGPSFR